MLGAAATLVASQLAGNRALADSGVWGVDSGGNWSDTSNWLVGQVADGTDATADFAHINIDHDNTITLDSSHTLGSLLFSDTFVDSATNGNWILTGPGSVTLKTTTGTPTISAGTLNVAVNSTIISATLQGTQGFSKLGAGTLTLDANNLFTGSVNISQGYVRATHANSFGAATGDVQITGIGASTIDLRADPDTTFNFNLTATANVNLNADWASITSANTSATSSNTHTIGNVTLVGQRTFTNVGTQSSSATVGTLSGGYNLATGIVSFDNSEIIQQNSRNTLTLGGLTSTATNAATITFNYATPATAYAGNINVAGAVTEASGPLTLVLNSNRTLSLNGPLAYTGGTYLNGPGTISTIGSTLVLGNNVALPSSGPVTITHGSILYTSSTPVNSTIGTLTLGGSGPTGLATSTSTVTLGNDVVYQAGNANGALITGNLNLGSSARTFTIAGTLAGASPELQVDAVVSDSGTGLIKNGAGQMRFTAANSITGPFAINAGTLSGNALASGNAFTSGAVGLNGGALNLVGQASAASASIGALSIGDVGAPLLVVNSSAGGQTTLNVSSFVGRSGAFGAMTVIPVQGSLNTNEVVTFVTAPSLTNGILPAYVATQHSGTDAAVDFLSLSGNNLVTATYATGDINAAASNAVFQTTGAQTLTADRQVFALNASGASAAIGGSQKLTVGDGTNPAGIILNDGASITATTLSFGNSEGIIWAAGNAAATVSSQMTLANTLSTAGNQTLNLNGAINLGGGDRVIAPSGTGAAIVNGLISSGNIIKQGSGTLILAANQTNYSGTTTINNGTLQIGNGAATGTQGPGNITTNANLVFKRTDAYAVANNISGTGNVWQSGTGTLSFSGALSYSGVTNVQSGLLRTTGSTVLPSNSGLAVFGGATFDLNGINQNIATLSSGGTTVGTITSNVAGNVSLTVSGAADSNYTGVITNGSGVLSLIKNGAGRLTLAPTTGSSNFTGGTTINQGTVYLGDSYANNPRSLGGAGTGATGTITLNGGTLALAGAFSSILNANGSTLANRIVIPNGGVGTILGGLRGTASGTLTGGATSTLNIVVPFEQQYQGNNAQAVMEWGGGAAWTTNSFQGQINVFAPSGPGNFRFNQGGANTNVYPATSLNDGVTAYGGPNPPNGGATNSTADVHIAELTGTTGATLGGSSVPGRHVTYHVGWANTDATFNGTIQDSLNSQGFAGFGDMGLEKVGFGVWTLNGPVTYGPSAVGSPSGFMTVTTGTLAIGAQGSVTGISTLTTGSNGTFAIDSGGTLTAGAVVNNNGYFVSANGFSTNASMTFTGTGTVSGNYTHSAGTLGAGADGTAGILTFANDLTLSGGTVKVDINNPTGVGILGGANDELQVLGNLTLSPSKILVRILGSAPTAADVGKNFPFMSVGGTINGLATLPSFTVGATTRGNYTVIQDPSIASQLDIHIAGLGSGGANLTWTASKNSNWDLNTTTNWVDSTGAVNTYFDGDSVNFASTGTSHTIAINGTLLPASVLIDSATDYTFNGPGSISGATIVTKNNTNTATFTAANSYTGGTVVNGGTIVLNNAAGAGTGTITLNNATLFSNVNTPSNPLQLNASNTGTLIIVNDNNGSYSGNLSGAGTLQVTAVKGTSGSNLNLISLGGNMDNFTGTLAMNAWPGAATPAYSMRLVPNGTINTTATINVGNFGGTLMNRAGGTYTVGMILGGQNSFLAGNQTANTNPTTWVVGGSNASGVFNGAITNSNNPTSIVKQGTGTWTLTNTTSTYTGTTTVNAGILNLNGAGLSCATYTVNGGTLNVDTQGVSFTGNAPVIQVASGGALDVSSQFNYQMPANLTIAGTGGTVWGETTLGAGTLAPGTVDALTVGTINFHDTLHVAGGAISMDLNTSPAVGSGTNDLINAASTLDLASPSLMVLNFLTPPTTGNTYTLITYPSGQETGDYHNLTLSSRATGTVIDTGSAIEFQVTGFSAGNLTWRGQTSSVWDVGLTKNWANSTGGQDNFYQQDAINFDDQAGVPTTVTINSYVVAPASIIVNSNTNNYTFSGTGTISGATSLVKNGTSTLTISTNNNYTGGTTINGGTVTVTSPQPFVGNVALNNGAAIAAFQSTQNTAYGWGTLATVNVAANNTATISMIQQNNDSTFTTGTTLSMFTSGTLTGGGTVNYVTSNLTSNATLSTEVDLNTNAGAFAGTINFVNVAPRTTIRMAGGFGSATAFYNLGNAGVMGTNAATTVAMGALTGGASSVLKGFEGVNGANAGGAVTYQIGSLNLDTTFSGGILDGTGTAGTAVTISKFGTGKLTLSGTNSFTGSLIVNSGTVALATTGSVNSAGTISVLNGATFDATASGYSPIVTANINGSGHIQGNVTLPQGASLTPGAAGTVGTLAFANNLTVSTLTLNSDLGATGTVGGGVNDLVDVTGQFTLNGTNTLNPNFLGVPTVGSYPLIRYGTKTGTGTIILPANLQLRGTASVDFSQANLISLTVSAITPGNLVWRGTGNNGGIWDVGNHANWIFNSSSSPFYQFDNVSFLDTTGAPSTVNLLSAVDPGNIVVNSTTAFNYNISGPGTITGPGGLTKLGPSTLTLQISNSYIGGTTLSGGVLNVGTFGNTALGTGPINLNGGTLISTGTGTIFFSSNINAGAATTSTLTINGTGAVGNISGDLSGTGSIVLTSDNTGKLFDMGGSNSTYGGTLVLAGTQTIRLGATGGSGLATWNVLNGGTISTNTGTTSNVTTIQLGALNGNATATLKGYNAGGSGGNIAYQLGDANVSANFAGNIIDGASGTTARPVSIIKSGTATQTLSGSNSYTGVTQVNSGTLVLAGSNAWTPALTSNATTAGMVLIGGRAIFDYSGSPASDPATTIAGILQTGSGGGFLTGQIRTGNAPDNRHGIGWIDNPGASKVTVGYTYLGDANVDGQVTTADFTLLSQNFNSTSGTWGIGDFNYDGKVNALDFNAIAINFGATPIAGNSINAPALGTVVPEPSTFAAITLAALPLLRRRRRGLVRS